MLFPISCIFMAEKHAVEEKNTHPINPHTHTHFLPGGCIAKFGGPLDAMAAAGANRTLYMAEDSEENEG